MNSHLLIFLLLDQSYSANHRGISYISKSRSRETTLRRKPRPYSPCSSTLSSCYTSSPRWHSPIHCRIPIQQSQIRPPHRQKKVTCLLPTKTTMMTMTTRHAHTLSLRLRRHRCVSAEQPSPSVVDDACPSLSLEGTALTTCRLSMGVWQV